MADLGAHVLAAAPAALRRNGKKPSCEPCRRSKLSCEHVRPICGRCRRRRAPDRCVYHPAPMTSGQRLSLSSTSEHPPQRKDRNGHLRLAASVLNQGSNAPTPLLEGRLADASPPLPGFLGSTSYSAVFTEGQNHISMKSDDLSREINFHGWQPSKLPTWDSSKVEEGAEILSLLTDLARYELALNRWYEVDCLSAITLYIRECMALIPSELKDSDGQSESLHAFVTQSLLEDIYSMVARCKHHLARLSLVFNGRKSLLGGCGTYAHRTGLERYLNARCRCI